MPKLKKAIYNLLEIIEAFTTAINRLITRDLLLFCYLLSFTFFLITLGFGRLKNPNEAMTAGGLFFTFVFSVWQYTESVKDRNCKNIFNVKEDINERVDTISTHFSRALNDIKDTSEKKDDKHDNEIDKIISDTARIENEGTLKLSKIQTELDYIKEQLTQHLNSFGHNKTIEQQQEIIKKLAHIEAVVTVSAEYAEIQIINKQLQKSNKQLEDKVKQLLVDFEQLREGLKQS